MNDLTDNTRDTIDVRDVIERIEEIENEFDDDGALPPEYVAEYAVLVALMDDLKGNGGDEQWRGDWYPMVLIRDAHFNDYMDEMVADCYEMPKDLPSFMTITLDYVSLQMDYSSVDIGGVTYWYR